MENPRSRDECRGLALRVKNGRLKARRFLNTESQRSRRLSLHFCFRWSRERTSLLLESTMLLRLHFRGQSQRLPVKLSSAVLKKEVGEGQAVPACSGFDSAQQSACGSESSSRREEIIAAWHEFASEDRRQLIRWISRRSKPCGNSSGRNAWSPAPRSLLSLCSLAQRHSLVRCFAPTKRQLYFRARACTSIRFSASCR